MKTRMMVLLMVLILLPLLRLSINGAFAFFETPVQTETVNFGIDGPVAKVGTTTQYPYIGPGADRRPQFYSALIASCITKTFAYYIEHAKIEVSGTDPLGDTLAGDRFRALSVLASPDESGVEEEILAIIWDYLYFTSPPSLKTALKHTVTPGGAITDWNPQKAWALWERGTLGFIQQGKGLRFGYQLAVDPAIEGTYTINVHYQAWIWAYDSIRSYPVGYVDLYDTVYHEYVNTPVAPSTPSGPASGFRDMSYSYSTSTTDPNGDSLKYEFDWGDDSTTITPGWYTSGAPASASHSWSSTGYKDVKVRAQDCTETWSDWSPILTVNIVNRAPNTPSKPSGPTYGYVGTYYSYSTKTTDPDGDKVSYKFDWGDGYTYTILYSSGTTVSRSHKWSTTGYKYVRVMACDQYGKWSGWSESLKVWISSGGGGCPILSVYDGTEYVEEGLLDIHNPEGTDMVYEHFLAAAPERVDGAYLFRLTEHPKTHSFIDQVKLYAMLQDGTMKELPLTWAWHSEHGNVLPQLLHSDEWKADTLGADHNDGTSQSIDLKFAALSPNLEITGFMFQIEGNNRWEK